MILAGYIFIILCVAVFVYSIWPRVDIEKGMLIARIDFEKGEATLQPKRYKTWWTLLMEWLPQSVACGSAGILVGFILGWMKYGN